MKKLMKILEEFEVTEHEVAEMMYAYLIEYGEVNDSDLKEELYKTFLKVVEI